MSEVRTPPKKLVDLNPKWIRQGAGVYGIVYDCPCASPDCSMGGRAVVPTKANFLGEPQCEDSVRRGWDVTGDSLENITLSPSIHHVGHWHGWVRNGVVESC